MRVVGVGVVHVVDGPAGQVAVMEGLRQVETDADGNGGGDEMENSSPAEVDLRSLVRGQG